MALADIFSRTRSILFGQGLGEKPALRIAASNANESVSGDLITFTLNTDEGAKVKPGNVLSVYDPDAEASAHVIYVTSIATDTITGVNNYLGSPAVTGADSGDLDSKVLEQNALVTSYEIFEAIDTVIARYLWPQIYEIETKEITSPDLVDGQEAVSTDVREILHAWQRIGGTNYPIAFQRQPWDVGTDLASTGRVAEFDWIDGSKGYFTAKTKVVEADEASTELTHLIALGAAAVSLGSAMAETALSSTKKDNTESGSRRNQVASILWRDFLTLKQAHAEELMREIPQRVVIDRG